MLNYISMGTLVLFLIISSITDLKERKIRDKYVFAFLLIRVLFIFDPLTLSNLYGLLFGFSVFFIPAFVLNRPMGGDIKAYALVGFFLGIELMLVHFFFTWLITIVSYGVGKITKKMKNGYRFPMAPVFLLAYFVTEYFMATGFYDTATMTIKVVSSKL